MNIYSQSSKGSEAFLDQEDHSHRSLDLCVSQVTHGSGSLAMTPGVLETRQRNMHNIPLST